MNLRRRNKIMKEKILKFNEDILRREAEEDEKDLQDVQEVDEEAEQEKKWDVDTILSTRTNTDNHPGLIKTIVKPKNKIKLDPKTKAPELEIEYFNTENNKSSKPNAYIEEIVSDEESEEEIEVNTAELTEMEGMTEKEKKKYLRKLNK